MSKITEGEITCPKCGITQECSSYSSMNVNIDPKLKKEFLSNEWNIFKCTKCGTSSEILSDMMYHDMENKFIVWYLPSGNIDQHLQQLKKYDHILGPDNYFSKPIVVSTREDAIFMVHLCDKNGPPASKEREGDYFETIQVIKNNSKNTPTDIKKYPTLARYQESQIWDAVKRLQEKYPDMTEDQCLLNLEMDLAEKAQLAKGE